MAGPSPSFPTHLNPPSRVTNEHRPLLGIERRAHLQTNFQASQNLMNAYLGAGILALPNAFARGGLLLSIGMVTVLGFVACLCVHWVIDSARFVRKEAKNPKSPVFQRAKGEATAQATHYAEVARGVGGEWACWITNAGIVAGHLGACTVYLTYIALALKDVFETFTFRQWLLVVTAPALLLAQFRVLKSVSRFSLVGNVVLLTAVGLVLGYGWRDHDLGGDDIKYANWDEIGYVFGTAAFAFGSAAAVPSIEARMRDRRAFKKTFNMSLFLVWAMYIGMGALGYLLFGEDLDETITTNLPDDVEYLVEGIQGLVAVVLLCTYVIILFPVSQALDLFILGLFRTDRTPLQSLDDSEAGLRTPVMGAPNPAPSTAFVAKFSGLWWAQSFGRSALVLLTLAMSVVFGEEFGLVVSFVGGLATGLLIYIIPGALRFLVYRATVSPTRWESMCKRVLDTWFYVFLVVLGIFASGLALYQSTYELLNGTDEETTAPTPAQP